MARTMRIVSVDCSVCKEKILDTDKEEECDECERTMHQKCTKLSEEESLRIEKFVCEECREKTGRLVEWLKEEPSTRQKQLDKERNYYEVEKILGMRIVEESNADGTDKVQIRQFKVKWTNYPMYQSSWVDEKFMDGCIDLLQQWLMKHDKTLSEIKGLMGSTSATQILLNEENWVDMNKIIDTFNKYRKYVNTLEIEVREWSSFGARDGIYFVNYERHCYVVLYLHQKEVGYIADGSNMFQNNHKYASGIRALLKIKLVPCEFNRQTAVDHCGSSAVLIALEFLRAYNQGTIPKVLTVTKRLKERVVKHLHPHASTSLPDANYNHHPSFHRCQHCARCYRPGERRRFLLHLRHCVFKASSSKNEK